jgi:hypothetical protein
VFCGPKGDPSGDEDERMTQWRRFTTFVWVAALLLSASLGTAKVRGVSLAELTQLSDQIVVGKVLRVHQVSGLQVAELEVAETLKGDSPLPTLFFLAQPTWICDITEAEAGESALLFLQKSDGVLELQSMPPGDGEFRKAPRGFRRQLDRLRRGVPFFVVAQAGRGHMVLRSFEGQDVATVWTGDVLLPSAVPSWPGPEPEYSFIRSVPLAALRGLILEAVRPSSERAAEQ